MKALIIKIREYLRRKTVRRQLRRVVSVFASIVVFVTTYALLLPGLTLEAKAVCGKEEHQHTAECYTDELVCGQEESDGHQHTDECYNEAGELICGKEESEGHHHDESCYKSVLTCGKEVHMHTKDCYAKNEPEEDTGKVSESGSTESAEAQSDTSKDSNGGSGSGSGDAANGAGTSAADGTDEGAASNSEKAKDAAAGAGSTDAVADGSTGAEADDADKAAPEKLAGIDFRKFLTDDSTIYYHPAGTGSDVWEPVDSDVRDREDYEPSEVYLTPDEDVLIHIAYELPAGTINETNAETEYRLPLLLEMSSDEVKDNNKYRYQVFDGDDREADDLTEAGRYEIKEKRNSKGEVTERWLVINWNEETSKKCGGEKLADGTVSVKPSKVEGFLELRVSARELLTLEKVGEKDKEGTAAGTNSEGAAAGEGSEAGNDKAKAYVYELLWGKDNNKNKDLSTTFLFDGEAVKALVEKEKEAESGAAASDKEAAEASQAADEKETADSATDQKVADDAGKTAETKDAADAKAGDSKDAADAKIGDSKDAADAKAGDGKDMADAKVGDGKDASGSAAADEKGTTKGRNSRTSLEYKGGSYVVTASFDESAGLPEGTVLSAAELNSVTSAEYAKKAKDALESEESGVKEIIGSHFYDIRFVDENGEALVPAEGSVIEISIRYMNPETISDGTRMSGVCFGQSGTAAQDGANGQGGTAGQSGANGQGETAGQSGANENNGIKEIDVKALSTFDNSIDVVTFSAEESAVYGVLNTKGSTSVNKGTRYVYHIEQDQEVSVSEILDELRILDEGTGTILTAEDVQEVVSSNEEVIGVTHKTKFLGMFGKEDWLVKGLQHFNTEEVLTVTLRDERVLKIAVTEADQLVSSVITADGENYKVSVSYGAESGIPEGASLEVKEIAEDSEAYAAYLDEVQAALEAGKKVQTAKLFDITILDSEGQKVEPAAPVRVNIEFVPADVPEGTSVELYHFEEKSEAPQVMENVELREDEQNAVSGLEFETDGFSVYGVVYTVDFEYAVNGKTYQFSLPGGGFVSFTDLVEVLGVVKDAELDEAESDAAKKFVADVASVAFSNPELVDVSKADADTTVGQIKESRELECEYSAELTEEQIAEINAQTVEAGDWALVSVQPFTSEETLTVTMKDGEVFTIRVTDYQISTNVLTADGKNYKITVTYDDDAEIPVGTQLVAEEIEPGTDEYLQRMGQTWFEINKDYFEVEELRRNYNESMDFLPEVNLTNLDSGRYFDIKLIYKDEEIEPSAPVHVEIEYVDGLTIEDSSTVGVAHFSDDGLEIIDEVDTKTEDSEVVYFSYDQKSFSDTGTFISHETHDLGTQYAETLTNIVSDQSFVKADVGSAEPKGNGYSKSAVLRAGEGSTDAEEDELPKPTANKTLEANTANGKNDGTYTLTLSVSGTAKQSSYSDVNKSNVLIVMDRSSSMTSNFTYVKATGKYDSDLTYYGVLSGNISDSNRVELSYWDNTYHYYSYGRWYVYNGDVYNRKTRMAAEQDALASLITQLTNKNLPGQSVTDEEGNTVSLDDIIEVKLISFASGRTDTGRNTASGITHTGDFTNTESNWGTSYTDGSTLKNAVTDGSVAKGTNWEEALEYAKEVADAKKAAQPDEPVYVIFLTDGEPTDIHGDNGNAQWYQDNVKCLKAAEPDAKAIVDPHTVLTSDNKQVTTDHKFYGIFTYGDTDTMKSYLRRLVNYAYGKGDDATASMSGGAADYYFDADSTSALLNAFQHIMSQISESVAYGKVSITDGLTTDAMSTTLVHGKAEGYKYTVTGAVGELYSVTAKSPAEGQTEPTVTFTISGNDYPGKKKTAIIDGKEYAYWSCTAGEGDNAAEYKMTLADVSTDGTLTWDLTGIGTLMDGYTYSASFVVWPDQDAYDYVAALNNGITGYTWDTNASTYEDLTSTKGYAKGGVEQYPSIVKYTNGVYAVLTNTEQKVHYSIVETKMEDGETTVTYDGPYDFDLPTPEPMPLTATKSQLEKVWNVERNPAILAQLLYGGDEHYAVKFDILRDDDPDTNEDDANNKYTDVTLGWDPKANGGKGAYVWDPNSVIPNVEYNGQTYSVGTRWVKEFSIATGLALSTERMEALGLDKDSYKSAEYDGKTYYILEDGHDYSIKELDPRYEFDFESPIYHPMIVDGVLKSVNVTKDEQGKISGITKMEDISVDEDGTSSLKVENNLRGYLHLNKVVVDQDAKTPLPADDTKFEFEITLTDSKGRFSGADIPWYGINGLFYHDEDFNYYQADPTTSGHLRLETEYDLDGDGSNDVYDATCNGNFNPDIIGPTTVTYTDKLGKEVTIQLYGNQTTASDDHMTATATMAITQKEVLNIANIPEGSTYRIEERETAGYEFVKIDWEIKNGDDVETLTDSTLIPSKEGTVITGTIISNRDNHVTYTNKCLVTDISIQKLDGSGSGKGLAGAVFQLKTVSNDGLTEKDATTIGTISGIGDVTKNVGGETKTFTSSFETTGKVQTLSGLPNGTYRLYEVYVPDGYITKVKYIQFKIENRVMKEVTTDTGDTSMLDFTAASTTEAGENTLALLKITNTPGAALPAAGGPGTRLFTILGSILILGAGALLWRRRRLF